MSKPSLIITGVRPNLLAFLHRAAFLEDPLRRLQPLIHRYTPLLQPTGQDKPPMDSSFINALIQAGTCHRHKTLLNQSIFPTSFFSFNRAGRKSPTVFIQYARHLHDSPASKELRPRKKALTQEECIQLVDYYRESYTTQACPVESNEGETPRLAPPAPSIVEDHGKPETEADPVPYQVRTPTQDEHAAILQLLCILDKDDAEQKQVFDAYSALPFPGVAFLEPKPRRLLLRRLSQVEVKCRKSMLRYLSVIDDMKGANIEIIEAEWNSAISFAGRCYQQVTAVEVEAALRIWKEMEEEAGVQSGHVTFSILFDIATKAGKYVLAEMILKEMASRNIRLNRFAHVGLIYYYGVRQDGQGVRKAYRDLVEAGHVVDCVVMDCVVAAFLRARELPAAELVYERRKKLVTRREDIKVPVMTWQKTRELGNVLDRATLAWTEDRPMLQRIQAEQYLGPHPRMYTSFIEYHVSVSGELRQLTNMLDEMQSFGIPMDGRMFVKIFKGFAFNGGVKYTSWTRARLEHVWTALKTMLDSDVKNISLQKWMVIWIIRAFAKCSGEERSKQLWAEVRSRWKSDPNEMSSVHHILTDTLNPVPGSTANWYRKTHEMTENSDE
ncbi:MAG: hypothetical protein HETSPECPRED_008252 [Heterodermia speciosa]|uniref:Pentatricopeptide repeat-containing protein n=1 Tax=Heterodermia speciosa TaxID=116794 RepID=A0A8H3IY63_9LECA|nr:MAG: hypothetical protein HETSPECPRED_008252 [Heterodermia speciosa]